MTEVSTVSHDNSQLSAMQQSVMTTRMIPNRKPGHQGLMRAPSWGSVCCQTSELGA